MYACSYIDLLSTTGAQDHYTIYFEHIETRNITHIETRNFEIHKLIYIELSFTNGPNVSSTEAPARLVNQAVTAWVYSHSPAVRSAQTRARRSALAPSLVVYNTKDMERAERNVRIQR
jgi:hypothetical protein